MRYEKLLGPEFQNLKEQLKSAHLTSYKAVRILLGYLNSTVLGYDHYINPKKLYEAYVNGTDPRLIQQYKPLLELSTDELREKHVKHDCIPELQFYLKIFHRLTCVNLNDEIQGQIIKIAQLAEIDVTADYTKEEKLMLKDHAAQPPFDVMQLPKTHTFLGFRL